MKYTKSILIYFTLFVLVGGSLTIPKKSHALCFLCRPTMELIKSSVWEDAREKFDIRLETEFLKLEKFIVHEMWEQSILPAMMLSAEQFTVVALQQSMAIGMFIDAEIQLETQRLLQEIQAQTHKRYHPSEGVCEFGTLLKSLAASERIGEITSTILSQRSQDRQLGLSDTSGTYGHDADHGPRILHFTDTFCNRRDRDNALSVICVDDDADENDVPTSADIDNDGTITTEERATFQRLMLRTNMDIDYFNLMDKNNTLEIDFTNDKVSVVTDPAEDGDYQNQDEENVFAMATNLYGYDTFARIPAKLLESNDDVPISEVQKIYMDVRSVIAKRSVAENSFYAIANMKTQGIQNQKQDSSGTPEVDGNSNPIMEEMSARPYMEGVMQELGVSADDARTILGENPSYFSQMEILTKKIYQNPSFYTNLYDKPANVARKDIAMQAIKLMQKFDMLKSYIRGEASISILLELAVTDLQTEVEDQIKAMKVSGN